jgi:uncharacterized protein (TIGR03089 family)
MTAAAGPAGARDVPALLAALQASDPGRPRVTWYGPGERVELSARVLTNWVAKTANLLVEELDAGPGTAVAIDLPPHWKQLVWALACWSVGAVPLPGDRDADVLVSSRPDGRTGPLLVAVALPSLARRFDPPPPPGWLDWAAEVAGFGDVLPPVGPLDHLGLLAAARGRGLAPGARVLAEGPDELLAALVADGSVVVPGRPLTGGERASERVVSWPG